MAQRHMSAAAMSYRDAVRSSPETKVTTLSNGLRVVSEQTPHRSATVGLYIDAGSRFEGPANNGTAHFLEHMAFKGTNNRTQFQLELEVENMGAMLNAYTSREMTAYYAKCFDYDIDKATEILSDLLQNPVLDKGAIEMERSTILREMQEVNDQPQELVLDYLHAAAYQGSSLGYSILGPEENIKSISQDDLRAYIDTHYTGPRMVLAAAGGVNHDQLVEIAEKNFGSLSAEHKATEVGRTAFTGSEIRSRDDDREFAHVAIAVEGCGLTHKDFYPLLVASMVVGAWDRSFGGGANLASPLASTCATNGFANNFTSFFTSYSDTGLWGCFAEMDRETIEEFTFELQAEWMRICTAVTDVDVDRAKNKLKAAIAFEKDGTTATCDEIGRQMLFHGRRVSPLEIDEAIESVTAESVRSVAYDYIFDRCPAVVGVGPIEALTDYSRIRGAMFWMRS
jgi:processing peptidase subunit beta